MNNLLFFNQTGDALNFKYDVANDKYSSTLNFDENSSDTFKTIGLYVFESVDSINFDSVDNDTNLRKFQLFNENRFTFNGSKYSTQSISSINSVNNNSTFYSKWIYGTNFESKFPIGSAIKFDMPVYEFLPNLTYVVVGTKKDAIMIISNLDNVSFNNLYNGVTFSNISISGLNSIGVYDYTNGVNDVLSNWNEPKFYDLLYTNKKLTILSGKTSSVVTVASNSLSDRYYYGYIINSGNYNSVSDFSAVLTLKTDLPTVYNGGLNLISSSNKVVFNGVVPTILKPGSKFIINDSVLNSGIITVANIPVFTGNVNTTFYPVDSQILWNNLIYQCVQSYTQSLTSSISPDNNLYWTDSINYLPSSVSLYDESLLNTSVHLTTNVFNYTQSFNGAIETTIGAFVQNYTTSFKSFNVDLSYDNGSLYANLIYPSNYATIDFYQGTSSISSLNIVKEKIIQTKEILGNYIDKNISNNYLNDLVISYIDDFGLKILINGQVYAEETDYVYDGLIVNQIKTIDRTLRNFMEKNFLTLNALGIGLSLRATNYVSEFDFYKDTIEFTTQFPNVSFNITTQMGSLAKYYVKHSSIMFTEQIGPYLNININGKDYGQSTVYISGIPDITSTLNNWVSNYTSILFGYGIYVSSVRNSLYFNKLDFTTKLTYTIKTNKISTLGVNQYQVNNYYSGKFGTLISGNEIIISSTSSQNFENSGFSTGMITSVNNTIYPYNNQEYNVIYVSDKNLGLSYQGPFWGTNGVECNLSALGSFGFSSLAYAITPCFIPGNTGSAFATHEFSNDFAINFVLSNNYNFSTYNTTNNNVVDALFVDEYNEIYVLGNYLSVVDAASLLEKSSIALSSTASNGKVVYNSYNKYLYVKTDTHVDVMDPLLSVLVYSINLVSSDIVINQVNGDVYIACLNSVHIFAYNNYTTEIKILSITSANKMEYNFVDKNIYVVGDKVYSINTVSRSVISSYTVTSLSNSYIFSEPIYGSIYVWGDVLYKITDGVMSSISLTSSGFSKILFNNLDGNIFISNSYGGNFIGLTYDDTILYSSSIGYGDIVVNQFDGDMYMITTSGRMNVIDTDNAHVRYTFDTGNPSVKILYNALRNSCISISSSGKLCELAVILNSVTAEPISSQLPEYNYDGYYGSLSSNYIQKDNIWLKTRQYLRKPRFNYSDDVQMQFVWKFKNDQVPNIFMYDISGNNLPSGTSYSYTGTKPLSSPVLNRLPNKDITKIGDSSVQQTIFSEIVNKLEYLDDANDISILPEPMEIFLGYNSQEEGYEMTTLNMYVRETASFSTTYDLTLNNNITLTDYGTYGVVDMNQNSLKSFVIDDSNNKIGFKSGQILQINVSDATNVKNKYISYNNGKIFKINQVYNTRLILDYVSDKLVNENNVISNYPLSGVNTVLNMSFIVQDKEMISVDIYGQTEIEDIRYKIELNNTGHNIDPSESYIFKTYDVEEQGIDWKFLNKKRKEMIMVRSDIFPYVGSYKAIINAINYFGYNDLVLYEYYRNINVNSPDFFKLFKVEIPDIFDNSVSGWTVNDFLKTTMPNRNYEETNLFNLTYLVTDKQGNKVLMYSLQEVLVKLNGLKNWLEKNVVPITHKVLDITGRTDFMGSNSIRHKSYRLDSIKCTEKMIPIDFNINEAYLMPVNSGSSVYNVVIDFVSKKGVLPTNFSLNIRTYKTYKEWNPFTLYNSGDIITYYGRIYKSTIDDNKIIDPRQYDDLPKWNTNTEYFDGQMVNYNKYAYEYLGTQSSFEQFGTSSVPTPAQTTSWLNISNWVQQDLLPVQTINEYRIINNATYSNVVNNILYYTSSVSPDYMKPSPSYNFSVDSNIDPFIVIEVNSENGYGLSYTSRKNYEIRGLNDLYAGVKSIESIGPFVPIIPITNTL